MGLNFPVSYLVGSFDTSLGTSSSKECPGSYIHSVNYVALNHFRDGLMWMVDLTVEINLRFQISVGWCNML